jgi:hypothetical protein
MKVLPIAVLLMIVATAEAKPVEVWECKDISADSETVLVTATVEEGRKKGSIFVAGVTYSARFEVAGFDRRWDFGEQPSRSYRYAFVIQPNGDAAYFDFGDEKKAKAQTVMKCHQTDAEKSKSKPESLPSNPSKPQEPVISGEGWKSVMNWRKLTTNMGTSDAQNILGEPQRVNGGSFTTWYYQNGGAVIFYEGKVYQWTEPRQ